MKNLKVTIFSLIAIICLYLAFAKDWLWVVPAILIMFINQKELLKNTNKKFKK